MAVVDNRGFDWVLTAGELRGRGVGFAVATVIAVAGSAPRHCGAKMIITADAIFGSVGGGKLEHTIVEKARGLLADSFAPPVVVGAVSLAASLGQCCGGKVAFVIERAVLAPPVAVFGAGHIGLAFSVVASLLPCRVVFYDSRQEWLDKLADGVGVCHCEDLPDAATNLSPQTFAVVMTHCHSLDLDICAALLARADIPFVGLVGSHNKARRFVSQLQNRRLPVDKLHCPLGGKANLPGEVAVKIAAQLIDALPQQKRADAKNEAAIMRELSQMASAQLQ